MDLSSKAVVSKLADAVRRRMPDEWGKSRRNQANVCVALGGLGFVIIAVFPFALFTIPVWLMKIPMEFDERIGLAGFSFLYIGAFLFSQSRNGHGWHHTRRALLNTPASDRTVYDYVWSSRWRPFRSQLLCGLISLLIAAAWVRVLPDTSQPWSWLRFGHAALALATSILAGGGLHYCLMQGLDRLKGNLPKLGLWLGIGYFFLPFIVTIYIFVCLYFNVSDPFAIGRFFTWLPLAALWDWHFNLPQSPGRLLWSWGASLALASVAVRWHLTYWKHKPPLPDCVLPADVTDEAQDTGVADLDLRHWRVINLERNTDPDWDEVEDWFDEEEEEDEFEQTAENEDSAHDPATVPLVALRSHPDRPKHMGDAVSPAFRQALARALHYHLAEEKPDVLEKRTQPQDTKSTYPPIGPLLLQATCFGVCFVIAAMLTLITILAWHGAEFPWPWDFFLFAVVILFMAALCGSTAFITFRAYCKLGSINAKLVFPVLQQNLWHRFPLDSALWLKPFVSLRLRQAHRGFLWGLAWVAGVAVGYALLRPLGFRESESHLGWLRYFFSMEARISLSLPLIIIVVLTQCLRILSANDYIQALARQYRWRGRSQAVSALRVVLDLLCISFSVIAGFLLFGAAAKWSGNLLLLGLGLLIISEIGRFAVYYTALWLGRHGVGDVAG
jgi:hypothetical protein